MGKEGVHVRIKDQTEIQNIMDAFASYGHTDIDTSRVYSEGTSEETLRDLGVPTRFKVSTKIFPVQAGDHRPERLRETVQESLKALGVSKVPILYLHAPDTATPFEETMLGVQALYNEGLFDEFGLSNFATHQVVEIYMLAKQRGWVVPTVYEGMYNALSRTAELDLFPALERFNIRFYAFSPLVGGLLDPSLSMTTQVPKGSQFDPDTPVGQMYRARYWNKKYFDALGEIHKAVANHNMTAYEAAMRWIVHHSKLNAARGDGIIIGGSSYKEITGNLENTVKGPLPNEVVDVFEKAWEEVAGKCGPYYL
ncbi:hypothetical protein DFQ28_006886 [Apophysomyces sp. BC1034]|nr:hypothetical protein DFQ30_000025 [Apophysomyces sp. BC1015]KAG0181981.1 hypothetical protein DFQ29_006240 [Apophysomyces sp. BC1021]KAG0193002.1 hypothetical protein DFQ28_006886 [Apophysomyces sp. BC1034]